MIHTNILAAAQHSIETVLSSNNYSSISIASVSLRIDIEPILKNYFITLTLITPSIASTAE